MKIGPGLAQATAICGSTDAAIWVRGRDLAADLMGKIGFTDYFWLLLTGASPTPAQSRILDATLVAIAEHGLVPSVQASRMTLAAAPEALQGAVAAGLLGCGSVILGSAEAAGRFSRRSCGAVGEGEAARGGGRRRWCANIARRHAADPGIRAPAAQARRSARRAASRDRRRGSEPPAATRQIARTVERLLPEAHRQAARAECFRRHTGGAARCRLSAGRAQGGAAAGAHGRAHRTPARGADAADRIRDVAMPPPRRSAMTARRRRDRRRSHERDSQQSARVSTGIRVVEQGTFITGPCAGMMLADLGRRCHQGREPGRRSLPQLPGRPVLAAFPGLQPQQARHRPRSEARRRPGAVREPDPRSGRLHPELQTRHRRAPRLRSAAAATL